MQHYKISLHYLMKYCIICFRTYTWDQRS